MRKIILGLFLLVVCAGCRQQTSGLRAQFKNPGDSVQTSVYWYWINDNISEYGALKDLEAMKSAGINRAFIGWIGLDKRGPEFGNCKIFSEEWWQIVRAVFKRADELDIEIGFFNSPGWSQSGGPWVTSEQAMRYLKTYEYELEGGKKIDWKLPSVPAGFQDVRVLAFPKPMAYRETACPLRLSSSVFVEDLNFLMDNDTSTCVSIPEEMEISIYFDEPVEVASLAVMVAMTRNIADGQLWAKKEGGGDFQMVREFGISRFNYDVKVGFVPDAPVVVAFEGIRGKEFKLVFKNLEEPLKLREVFLYKTPLLESYLEKSLAKMYQQTLPSWSEYQWDTHPDANSHSFALIPAQVRDITPCFKDGRLKVKLPAGDWIVQRLGMLPTGVMNHPVVGVARGLEIDKMNKEHTAWHFTHFIGEILVRIPASDRKAFKYVVADSYETGGQNFTDDMLEEFKKVYHYDPVPFLPVFNGTIVQDTETSDRFLWDFRRLIADKIAYDYVGGLRKMCHANGLFLWLENYGHWGFPAEFLQYGGQADEVAGEFWSYGMLGNIENRAASSCGHIYGKNKISAESFTCGPDKPYSRYPAVMKQRGDRFFSEGINSTLLHVYIAQPDDKAPGINAWFGNEFNRHNTWFPFLDLFTDYLKRVNLMLQQGLNVADVAYFIGEDTPKMTGTREPGLPEGYQFDYINAEVLLRDMRVENGDLTLPHGTRYKVLVLPPQPTMRPAVLRKIKELISMGGIVLGDYPLRSPSNEGQPATDDEIRKLVKELWGENADRKGCHKIGKGKLYVKYTLTELFEDINLKPDMKADKPAVLYSHRACRDKDIYFITNQEDRYKETVLEFRTSGKYPKNWNPVSGEINSLTFASGTGAANRIVMKLHPYESTFVVFEGKRGKDVEEPLQFHVEAVGGEWNVVFKNSIIDTDEIIKMNPLVFWNHHDNDLIKYYSGTAVYTTHFQVQEQLLSKAKKITLDLGRVEVMAKVYVNDVYVGGVWTAPYCLDISGPVRPGNNELRVEVVNTWVNRLIGDAKLPQEGRTTFTSVNPWKESDKLQDSGLLGPVNLLFKK